MAEATDVMGGEPQVEAEGLASATAEQQREFGWAADIASAAMPEFGSMTAHGRHYPTMSQRKPGSTVALLRRAKDLRAIYLGRRLDPGFREEIMLSVAGANSCRQCSFAHRQWALAEGVSSGRARVPGGTGHRVVRREDVGRHRVGPGLRPRRLRRGSRRDRRQLPAALQPRGAGGHRAGRPDDVLDERDEQRRTRRPEARKAQSGAGKHGDARAPGGACCTPSVPPSSSDCCASSSDGTRSRCFARFGRSSASSSDAVRTRSPGPARSSAASAGDRALPAAGREPHRPWAVSTGSSFWSG